MDAFNYNYAQAKAASGNFQEAEEVFLLINSDKFREDPIYVGWLARCCEFYNANLGTTPDSR